MGYTKEIMSYLLNDENENFLIGEIILVMSSWASKPNFFTGHQPFLRETLKRATKTESPKLEEGKVYHGGNATHFKEAQIYLATTYYMGDHIFSDIMKSKGTLIGEPCLSWMS